MNTWTPNAEKYDFGRPFPAEMVIDLFFDVAQQLGNNQQQVFEPGSGTGRVLIPLAHHLPHWIFTGMDSSRACLEVSKKRASELALRNITFMEGLLGDALPEGSFDLIIHSSVLHVIPNWSQVMEQLCAKLKPDGLFCLIGDYGDIYAEVLGRHDSADVDQNLSKFWRRYLELRTEVGAPGPESSQIGCRWDLESTDLASWLEHNNFSEFNKREARWVQTFTLRDLLKIVEERCYSSMFTLQNEMIDSIVAGLKESFAGTSNWSASSKHRAICRFYRHK
jgi:SAM-dependent methyltransferase